MPWWPEDATRQEHRNETTTKSPEEPFVSSIERVGFAGIRRYPPSWVGAMLAGRSFWVDCSGKCFAMELKD
jgi:hypothetical protein